MDRIGYYFRRLFSSNTRIPIISTQTHPVGLDRYLEPLDNDDDIQGTDFHFSLIFSYSRKAIKNPEIKERKPKIGLSKCNEELFKYDSQFKLPAKISQLIAADAAFKKFPLIMGVQ